MTDRYVPPYPTPPEHRASFIKRFLRGWKSWIHVGFEKSYTMKMGEFHAPRLTFYVANEPSLVERIMVTDWRRFPKHRFMQELLDPLIGNSVFSANGTDWEQQRTMVNPAFSHTALRRVFPLMAGAVDDLVARVRGLDLSRAVEIDPLMTHVAADIIYRTLFSRTLDAGEAAVIYDAFNAYQRHAQSSSMLRIYGLPSLGFRGRAQKDANRINAVFAPIVRARYDSHHGGAAADHADILQSLLEARHPETAAPFSYAQVMEQVSTIFLAGHETAASAMTWALYLIAACPHLQDAIRAEIAGTAGDAPLGYESLKALDITRNAFRETLRLYPPLAFLVREVIEPTQMRNKTMTPEAMLVVSPWLVQRNRDNWEDPHAFDPDRFDRPEAQHACRHAYLPFGKGPRICIGAGFAQQEALLLIAGIVRTFRIETIAGDVPEPVSRLTLRPGNGVRLRLTALS